MQNSQPAPQGLPRRELFNGEATGEGMTVAQSQPLRGSVNGRKQRGGVGDHAKDVTLAIRNTWACKQDVNDRYSASGLHGLKMRKVQQFDQAVERLGLEGRLNLGYLYVRTPGPASARKGIDSLASLG